MHCPGTQDRPARDGRAGQLKRVNTEDLNYVAACSKRGRHQSHQVAFAAEDHTVIRVREPGGGVHKRLQHGLEIERRGAHDLQDLCGRLLTIERLLRLVEETNVLDRDDGLVRERLDELDLAWTESGRLRLAQQDYSYRRSLAQHRRRQSPALSCRRRSRSRIGKVLTFGAFDVGDAYGAPLENRARGDRVTVDRQARTRRHG